MSFYLMVNLLLHLLLALILPVSNDEAYYWDWGQWLQWSYFDHPPGISWMTGLASYFFEGRLGIRLLSPFLHTLLLAIHMRMLEELPGFSIRREKSRSFLFFLWLSSPGLFLMGSLALPDMGLWVFLQLGLWYSLKLCYRSHLKAQEGLLWGTLLGAAALFKYHAFPMGFSIGVGLLFLRLREGKREPMFFITGLLAALVILSPLWYWNIQHDWASFRFQAAHGFAAGRFSLIFPLQAILACALIVGPPLFYKSASRIWLKKGETSDPLTVLTLLPVLTLCCLLATAALRKPILPHWILPGFAIAMPWLVKELSSLKTQNWWRWQLGYGSALLVVATLTLNPLSLRSLIIPSFAGDPGPLSEITVWDELAPTLRQQLSTWEQQLAHIQQNACENSLPLATYRWWGAAQLHLRLQDRSPVLSLQDLSAGFYNERDKGRLQSDCPLAILLTADQWRDRAGLDKIEVLGQERLVIPQHEKQSWVLVLGRWKTPSS